MKTHELTESGAVALNAACQCLETIGLKQPLRWIREITTRESDAVNMHPVDCHFWILGDPNKPYRIQVLLTRKDRKNWEPVEATGFTGPDMRPDHLCSFWFGRGKTIRYKGIFPYPSF